MQKLEQAVFMEHEFLCSCGCGQTAKGIGVGPMEWFHFSIWEPRYYEAPQVRCHDLVFASRYCIRRYFKDWQPLPLEPKTMRGRPRKYRDNAEKQAAWRERQEETQGQRC